MKRPVAIVIAISLAVTAILWWAVPDRFRQAAARLGHGAAQTATAPAGQRTGPAQRPPAPVEVVTAATGRVADEVEALGTLTANETVAVAPEVAGRIVALPFREGERVEARALLLQLDATIAEAELAQSRANLSLAEDVLARNQTLVQRGAGTQVSLEQAAAQLSIARANLSAAEARLQKLQVHAPFAGVIGLRSVSVGTIVQPGQAIATLTSVDPIKVDFGVPELFLSAVRVGQALEVKVDAAPDRSFRGEVYAIDPVIEVSGRALRLRATVPNGDGVLKPGLFARVRLTTAVRDSAVLVPEAALVAAPGGRDSALYVVRENRAALVPVSTGRRVDGRVEITEGVTAGEVVVTAGQALLRDGASVAIAPQPARPAAPAAASMAR